VSSRLVVVGDAVLDRDVEGSAERLAPDAPVPVVEERESRVRPGGAGLAAVLATRDGHDVTLVTALAADAAGVQLRAALEDRGVEVVDIGLEGFTPEKVRIRASGRPLLRLDRGGPPGRVGEAGAAARALIGWAEGVLVSDYGRGITGAPSVRAALADATQRGAPVVWDPHPRAGVPVPGATLCTPNEAEAHASARAVARAASGESRFSRDGAAPSPAARAEAPTSGLAAAEDAARSLLMAWRAWHVCVTLGAAGAVITDGDGPAVAVTTDHSAAGDPCGAGDRFAARAAGALLAGESPVDAVTVAVAAASAFVRAGGAFAVDAEPHRLPYAAADPTAVAERVRAEGGTVVATGGCFDLLHAGHVRTLRAARELGDCLIVCLNSDASIRRLKGPERPIVSCEDRAAVLAALGCVDAVAVFDDDSPARILERLQPDLWAKGGDYVGAPLVEASVLARWGGRAVLLPYVDGRSTTRLIEEARSRAGA